MTKKIMKKKIASKKTVSKKNSKKSTNPPSRPFPLPKSLRIESYWKELNKVIDPELNLGVVDIGLIYDVQIKNGNAKVFMTLTSPACPVGPMLIGQVEDRMRLYKDIKNVKVEIVWDPVWTQEFMDPDIRDLMFGF